MEYFKYINIPNYIYNDVDNSFVEKYINNLKASFIKGISNADEGTFNMDVIKEHPECLMHDQTIIKFTIQTK